MSKIVRAQYRSTCLGVSGTAVSRCVSQIANDVLREKRTAGEILHGSMFRYEDDLFLYLELVVDEDRLIPMSVDSSGIVTLARVEGLPHLAEDWFSSAAYTLCERPGVGGKHCWAYMNPVFWHDVPGDVDEWEDGRTRTDEGTVKPLGKIALLNPEKLASYVYHHQDITAEGLLAGPRTKFISLSGRVLFMAQDRTDERPEVNVRRSDESSLAIGRWEEADAMSHFVDLTHVPGKAFLEMETLAYV